MMAVCVDPAKINAVWPHFKHFIESAIEKADISEPNDFAKLEASTLGGKSLLWLAYDGERVVAASVTELVDGICKIVACGGSDLKSFLPCLRAIEQFAKDENCRAIRITGRRGWRRVLKNYRIKAEIIERKL